MGRSRLSPALLARHLWIALAYALTVSACGHFGYNFLHPTGPRFGTEQMRAPRQAFGATIRVVSFNIKFGRQANVERAIEYLTTEPSFRNPDVLFLQEMNCDAVAAIAARLDANWVYYPAAWHPQGVQWPARAPECPPHVKGVAGGYFGVGIVTPWTIRDDQKILLPQLSRSDDAQKVAVAATIDFGGTHRIRAVNVHLQSGLTPLQVGDQLQVVTQCVFEGLCPAGTNVVPAAAWAPDAGAERPPGNVVLAGDFNTAGGAHIQVMTTVLSPATKTRLDSPTFWLVGALDPSLGRLDHVFYGSGLRPKSKGRVGTTRASDHRPVAIDFGVVEGNR